jgi:PPOX class probable F420-dependent enzyme
VAGSQHHDRSATPLPRPSIRAELQNQRVIWLGSTRPDGAPHVVPIWFLWDGRSILVFSKPDAQKVRNVRANPRVMLAIGDPGLDFDVELAEAVAEVVKPSASLSVPSAFVTKYAKVAARAGLTMARFADVYRQPIRIQPTRWLGWGGRGWAGAAAAPPHRASGEPYASA